MAIVVVPVFHGARYPVALRVDAEVKVVESSFPSIRTTGDPLKLPPEIDSVTDPPLRIAGLTTNVGRSIGTTRALLVEPPGSGFVAVMEAEPAAPPGRVTVAEI
jgi:hypothetical protein